MEITLIEFELDMQTFFNTYFHLDWSISIWFCADVSHNELFFFGYLIILSIYNDIDVVSQANHYAIVCFKLFFNSIKLEVIWYIVRQSSGWFKVPNDL